MTFTKEQIKRAFKLAMELLDENSSRHGLTFTPECYVYHDARNRCENPRNKDYKNYGGRGIEFRFRSFKQFHNCVGDRPTPEHSLDRVNNEGHYEAGNVRWATRCQQAQNRRKPQKRVVVTACTK